VLRKFVRVAPVLNLHVGGRIIGTTAEHPFFVEGKGWTPAFDLRIGDRVLLEDGQCLRVEGIGDSGRVETVYNIEVENDHTYFVGEKNWGWAVWSHNLYEVGEYNQVRKLSMLHVREANHAPQTRQAELLIGEIKRGKGISISLRKEEHDLITFWQGRRRELFGKLPASARELLAQDIIMLRKYTDAPNSSLLKLLREAMRAHKYDFLPLHRM